MVQIDIDGQRLAALLNDGDAPEDAQLAIVYAIALWLELENPADVIDIEKVDEEERAETHP